MTFSLRAGSSNDAYLQVNGVDQLKLTSAGALTAVANPATGLRSMDLATMQKFADEFTASKGTTGWQKLPSGVIIQWGQTVQTTDAAGNSSFSFPIAFPTACFLFVPVNGDSSAGAGALLVGALTIPWPTINGAAYSVRNTSSNTVYASAAFRCSWIAIGY